MAPKIIDAEEIKKKEQRAKRRLMPVATAAYADEADRWKAKAQAESRPLSSWIRLRVLQTEALEEERAARASERRDS
jgi:hypothetical protein